MNLRAGRRPLLIGHKGAAALEPENTLRSLARAVELGCDLVEFDVLDVDGRLMLGHSPGEIPEEPTSFDEALALLRDAGVGAQVDLKWHGYEAAAVEAIRQHGDVEQTLVSTCHVHSLHTVAKLEPSLTRGLTYPYDRHGFSQTRALAPFTVGALTALKRALPRRIEWLLERAQASVAVLNHGVVSDEVVERAHAAGAAVIAWTVDGEPALGQVLAAGVDGVVTNDPRIFPREV